MQTRPIECRPIRLVRSGAFASSHRRWRIRHQRRGRGAQGARRVSRHPNPPLCSRRSNTRTGAKSSRHGSASGGNGAKARGVMSVRQRTVGGWMKGMLGSAAAGTATTPTEARTISISVSKREARLHTVAASRVHRASSPPFPTLHARPSRGRPVHQSERCRGSQARGPHRAHCPLRNRVVASRRRASPRCLLPTRVACGGRQACRVSSSCQRSRMQGAASRLDR